MNLTTDPTPAGAALALTFVGPRDAAAVHALALSAAADSAPGQFCVNDVTTFAQQMRNGFTLVASVGDCMAGFLHVHFPTAAESYAERVGDDYPGHRVAHMDTVAVLPAFRGRRLMAQMLERAEEQLRGAEPDRVAWYATVHPGNHASRRSFERAGFVPVARVLTHGRFDRLVVRKLAG